MINNSGYFSLVIISAVRFRRCYKSVITLPYTPFNRLSLNIKQLLQDIYVVHYGYAGITLFAMSQISAASLSALNLHSEPICYRQILNSHQISFLYLYLRDLYSSYYFHLFLFVQCMSACVTNKYIFFHITWITYRLNLNFYIWY